MRAAGPLRWLALIASAMVVAVVLAWAAQQAWFVFLNLYGRPF
jgi:hypothetical protein